MEQVKKEEIARGMTLWGPHRDDLIISLNSLDLKLYGSQGQHRTAVLAIKLAELEFLKANRGVSDSASGWCVIRVGSGKKRTFNQNYSGKNDPMFYYDHRRPVIFMEWSQ